MKDSTLTPVAQKQARDLFIAEVMKAGGPLDRVGDVLEGCNRRDVFIFATLIGKTITTEIFEWWEKHES